VDRKARPAEHKTTGASDHVAASPGPFELPAQLRAGTISPVIDDQLHAQDNRRQNKRPPAPVTRWTAGPGALELPGQLRTGTISPVLDDQLQGQDNRRQNSAAQLRSKAIVRGDPAGSCPGPGKQ